MMLWIDSLVSVVGHRGVMKTGFGSTFYYNKIIIPFTGGFFLAVVKVITKNYCKTKKGVLGQNGI